MSTKILIGIGALAGAIIAAATGNWVLAIQLGIVGVGSLLGPSPGPAASERQGFILSNRVGAETPIPIVYGKTRIAGLIADRRIDSASTNNSRYVLVIAFCAGSRDNGDIDAIEDVWFDDRLAINNLGNVQAPFSTTVEGQGATKHLEYGYHLGSTSQVVDSRLTTLFPTAWPATAPGKHIAYARFELWFNRDVYPTGVPQIRATIRGRRVFDPRDLTWKYSDNPALCTRDFLLDPIHGMKLTATNLEEQSFIDVANYCDEIVFLPGGLQQKRYTLNGWVDTARPTHVNLAELASTCRGTIVNEGDKWRLLVRRQQVASGYKLNEDTMLEGQWSFVTLGSADAPNVARCTYIDPDREYQAETVQWPEPGAANPFLVEDNGLESRLEIDLPYVTSRLQAQHTVMTLLKELRQSPGMTAVLKESAVQLRVGERVDVTQPTPGWTDKPFWVQVLRIRPDAQVEAILTPYEPTVYDLDSQVTQPTVPPTNLPNPFAVAAPTGLTLVAGDAESIVSADGIRMPRIKVTWTRPSDPFLVNYQVQAKKTADAVWDEWGSPLSTETQFFVGPVTSESWDVRIRAINSIGVPSAWVSASVTPSVSSSITTFAKYRVENSPIASFEWRETDEVLPLGLWRAVLDADSWRLQKNTAAAGNFSTLSELLKVTSSAFTFLPGAAVSMGPLTASGQSMVSSGGDPALQLSGGAAADSTTHLYTSIAGIGKLRLQRDGFIAALGLRVRSGTDVNAGSIVFSVDNAGALTATTVTASGVATLTGGVTGANPAAQLVFSNYFDNAGDPGISHIVLYDEGAATSERYGFGVSTGQLNYFSSQDHVWYEVTAGGAITKRMHLTSAALTSATAGGLTLGTSSGVTSLPWGNVITNGFIRSFRNPGLLQAFDDIAGVYRQQEFDALDYEWFTSGVLRATMTSGGNVLIGTTTDVAGVRLNVIGGNARFGFDASNRLDITISSTGAVTYDAVGTGALHTFSDDLTIGSLGRFDSTDTPTDMQFLRFNASVAKWQADTLNTVVGTGDFHAAVTSDGTAVAYVDENLSPADGAVNEPGVPTVTAKHLGFELRIPGSYVKTANFKRFKWETCTGAGCVTWAHLIYTTSLSLIHARLTSGQVRRYRVRAESTTTVSAFATTGDVTVIAGSDTEAFGGIIGGDAVFVDLAALSGDFGIVKVGQMRNLFTDPTGVINFGGKGGIPSTVKRLINFEDTALPAWTDGQGRAYLNLFDGGAAGNIMLRHDKLQLKYDGTAIFKGQVDIAAGTLAQTVQDFHILLRDSDVAHGMTGLVETDILGGVGFISAVAGGLNLMGFSEAGTVGAQVIAHIGDNGASALPATIVMEGWAKSGTGRVAPTASVLLDLRAGSSRRFAVDATGAAFRHDGTTQVNIPGIVVSTASASGASLQDTLWCKV